MSFLAAAMGVNLLGKGLSYLGSRKEEKRASRKAREYEDALKQLEANRQDTINPYEDVTNPYNNLQVATGASEFEAEEIDISLANMLDTLNATGAGGGGATALAQAALRGKQGISNSIEEQEARNAELRAEGQARQEQLQGRGKAFEFNAQERRDEITLDRYDDRYTQFENLATGYREQGYNTLASLGKDAMEFGTGFGVGNSGGREVSPK